jgi:hypothetical protein
MSTQMFVRIFSDAPQKGQPRSEITLDQMTLSVICSVPDQFTSPIRDMRYPTKLDPFRSPPLRNISSPYLFNSYLAGLGVKSRSFTFSERKDMIVKKEPITLRILPILSGQNEKSASKRTLTL